MKIRYVLPLLATVVLPGCSSTWWKNFEANPVAQVQLFETAAQTTVSTAQVVWVAVYPLIPAASQAQAQADFNDAIVAVNDAVAALNDAVTVAAQAESSDPDFSTLESAVSDALAKVLAIIDQFKGTATVHGYTSLQTRVTALHAVHAAHTAK